MKIWIDGAGFNGKLSKYCIFLDDGKKIVKLLKEKRTNNEMEYMALLEALKIAKGNETIYTDSQLLVGHLTKNWKQNYAHLKKIAEECKKLLEEKKIKLIWIPREKNKAGKILEEEK